MLGCCERTEKKTVRHEGDGETNSSLRASKRSPRARKGV